MAGRPGEQKWKHGLFGCFSNCGICLYGYCCSPCLYGQNASDMGEGGCFVNCLIYYLLASFGCCCIVHTKTRKRLRAKYNLEEAPCGDCCVATFCCACGICQEANELKFQASRAPQQYHGTQMVPPQQQHFGGQQQYQQQQQPGAYPPPPSGVPHV